MFNHEVIITWLQRSVKELATMSMSYTIDYLISCCNTICHFVWADLLPAATSRGLSAGPGELQARRGLALCRVEQMGSPCAALSERGGPQVTQRRWRASYAARLATLATVAPEQECRRR